TSPIGCFAHRAVVVATSSTGSACSPTTGMSGQSSTWRTRRSSAARFWPRSRPCEASISTAGSALAAHGESAGAVTPTRLLPVPEGLVGMRLDVAVSRLFGLSRTAAAALIDSGDVLVDGGLPARSARLSDGSLLEVRLPDAVRDPMP